MALSARPADRAHRRRAVRCLGIHRPPGASGSAATGLPRTHHRRSSASRVAAALDRLLAPMGSRSLASPAVAAHNACAPVAFRAASRGRGDRGQPAAVALRFSCHSRRRPGGDDRRDRRTRRRRGRRVGVSGAASRPLSASLVVGPLPPRPVGPAGASSWTTSTSRSRCTDTGGSGAARSCWPGVATARWPLTWPATSACPAIRSSPTSTRSRSELRGLHPHNPVNRTRDGGTQLELPTRVRGISPRSPLPGDDGLSPVTSALVQGLAAAARSWKLRL